MFQHVFTSSTVPNMRWEAEAEFAKPPLSIDSAPKFNLKHRRKFRHSRPEFKLACCRNVRYRNDQ